MKLPNHARQEDLTLDSWITRLSLAKTVEDILAAAREYLDRVPDEFLSGLTGPCQPPELRSAQDISSYAFVLMNRCIAKECDTALRDMARFFAAASQCASVIVTPRGRFTARPKGDFL
jgi:hypothetical protein